MLLPSSVPYLPAVHGSHFGHCKVPNAPQLLQSVQTFLLCWSFWLLTSVLGVTQKPSGHSPEQPALGGPAWAGGLEKMTSRGPFQPQPSCDYLNEIFHFGVIWEYFCSWSVNHGVSLYGAILTSCFKVSRFALISQAGKFFSTKYLC